MYRPLRTATTGFVRLSRRVMRVNLRGLPMLSRYSRIRLVAASASQYCSRSLADTSARFPAETKLLSPSPRRATVSRTVTPSAPDWQNSPTRPRPGTSGDRLALRLTRGSVLMIPRQFGPTTRIPDSRALRTSCRWRARPSSVAVSANPEETTTSPLTPAAAHSATTGRTASAGTATAARSTGWGMSVMCGYAGTPRIESASGWIAYSGPCEP